MREKISHKISNGGIIAAAMVVGIHVCDGGAVGSVVWWWDKVLHYGLFLVAVPFFFVCSGYFLCRHYVGLEKEEVEVKSWSGRKVGDSSLFRVWRVEMLKRVRSLLVPFLLWSAIGLCIFELLPVRTMANIMHGRELLANWPEGWRFWARGFGVYPYEFPLVVPLWYVRALLIFAAISPVLFKLIEKLGGAKICAVIYFLWAILGASPEIGDRAHLVFCYCFSLQGLFFFAVGCALSLANEDKLKSISGFVFQWKMVLMCLAVGMGCVIFRTWLWQQMGWTIRHWTLLFVPPLLVVFWAIVPSRPLPRWLTGAAFPIYLMHTLLWVAVYKVCALAGCQVPGFMSVETIADWWIKWAVGFGGSLGLSLALRCILPRTAGVLFGGR